MRVHVHVVVVACVSKTEKATFRWPSSMNRMNRKAKKGTAAKKRKARADANKLRQHTIAENFARRLKEVLEEQRLNPQPRYVCPGLSDETW